MKKQNKIPKPSAWGLETGSNNELLLYDFLLTDFAELYGTPLYILDETRLAHRAEEFKASAEKNYPGKVSIHYPFKCNSVPAVVNTIKTAGLSAEVMTEYELNLALKSGFKGSEIIVNGPCKTDSFLKKCLDANVRFISVDSTDELKSLSEIATDGNNQADILLRINPDYIPGGLPAGSATGSSKSVFGLGLERKEINNALAIIKGSKGLTFKGFHFHIGTGIQYPRDYEKVIEKLVPLIKHVTEQKLSLSVIDVGGGYPSPGTRELRTRELILSQIFKFFQYKPEANSASFNDFTIFLN